MAGIVTYNFRFNNAEQFREAFSETPPDTMYYFLGRPIPWSDDNDPPAKVNSVRDVTFEPWQNIFAMKKITPSDVTYVVPRYNWASGTVFRQYDDRDGFLFSNTSAGFYCMTTDYNVYKCLWNNSGVASTVKPTGTSAAIIRTPDGYVWKYMYTLTSAEVNNFLTINHIPVKTLTANDGSAQWTVQENAANGSINTVKVTAGGGAYLQHVGTISAVINTTCVSVNTGASVIDDIYNGSAIYLSGGIGAGQIRTISDYIGSSLRVTVSEPFSPTPVAGTTTYRISPAVTITGDGSGAKAYAICQGGAVSNVTITSVGQLYSRAQITFAANTTHGSGAAARAIIEPPGGHGSDAVRELGGFNVMLYGIFIGSVSNTVTTENDFRLVGVIRNPRLSSNGAIANDTVYDSTTHLNVTGSTGAFTADEFVTGSSSGAKGRVLDFVSNTIIRLVGVDGTFSAGETITGNTSAKTATLSSITPNPIKRNAGDIIYIENRTPVVRSGAQSEEVKLICRF